MQCSAVQCSAVGIVQCSVVQCSAVQCSAVGIVQCSAVQCSAVQYIATMKRQLALTAVATILTLAVVYLQLIARVRLQFQSELIASRNSEHEKHQVTKTLSNEKALVTAIRTVYSLTHYGNDLCLLYNKPKTTTQRYKHPNIVHYVKIAGDKETDTELKLLDYVSILSVDKYYKPDKIVIHSNKNVTGDIWSLVNGLETAIEEQYIERSATIGRYKKPRAITHEADVHKLDIALREGGVVMDFDVIVLDGDNLRRQQVVSECVLGMERECTFANSGFISCTPNTTLVRKWRASYEDDYRNTWPGYLYNSGEVPAKLLRDCPSCYDVYLDPEICMNPDAGAPGGPGPGRDPWKVKNGVQWQNKTVVHVLLHHLNVPKTNYLLNLWDCSYKELVMYILQDSYKQFLPKRYRQ